VRAPTRRHPPRHTITPLESKDQIWRGRSESRSRAQRSCALRLRIAVGIITQGNSGFVPVHSVAGRLSMPEPKARCKKCGVEILQLTADRNEGMCVPCHYPRTPRDYTGIAVEPGRCVDRFCIDLHRDAETADYADYFFRASVVDKDPRFNNKHIIVGHNVGLLRIIKATGETQILYPMAEDEGDIRYACAAHIIRKHWKKGEFPENALFAAG
jgi:hypothetical protein